MLVSEQAKKGLEYTERLHSLKATARLAFPLFVFVLDLGVSEITFYESYT